MYDPKFEKAIQQKMEELEFRPPESVWVNIENAVVSKRRRRTGFLWRYLLPGVLVVAAAGLCWHYAGGDRASRPAATLTKAQEEAAAGNTGKTGQPLDITGATARTPASLAGESHAEKGYMTTGLAGHRRTAGYTAPEQMSATHRTTAAGQTAAFDGSTTARQAGSTGEGGQAGQRGPDGQAGQALPTGSTGRAHLTTQNELAAWFYLPGLADQRLTARVQASALNTKKASNIAMAGLSHPPRRWEAGFVAGGGLSRLNHLNSDQARTALAANAASLYIISNPSPSSTSHYISDVRPEASFEGGIYLQRPLSDRWIFHTGMNLHYYSNRITVGQQVTTYVQPSVSYILANTVQTAAASSVYSAGDTRSVINKYYFLELPVGMQFKINKSHLVPIFVEGDVSLSRLMGASALFYNAKTGLYSKDADIVNKTQFNIGSALLVGLPFRGVNIQVGPQIQYGLTPLVNTQGVGDQHTLYTGIRLVVIPGRK